MTVLPLAYLPSVEYFAHLLRGGCVVDLGEHFVKRSERNRARILATDGVMELTVHVRNANRPRQPVRDVRIDYSKRWQHQHWGALVASYKGSPYFDFYAEYFEPFYRREYGFLADYNRGLLELLCSLTHVPMPDFSESYVDAAAGMEGALKQYLDDYPGKYRLLNMSFRSQAQGVAFRKNGDTALAQKLCDALADMTADGTTAAIISAHGLNVEKNVYGGTTNADSRCAE